MTVIGVTATVHPDSFHLISFSRMGDAAPVTFCFFRGDAAGY